MKKIRQIEDKNISLTGFMGSGKSTIGKILAEKLNFLFLDLDTIIELSEGKKISEIFSEYGEKYFRDAESEVIKKIYFNRNCVFSCGGGVVLKKENMDIIKSQSIIIYLKISPQTAYERLKNVNDRPLLSEKNRRITVENLIKKRQALYKGYADIIIDADSDKPETIAEYIISRIS
ncbi:MAG: shikimate kinase [Actinobacteria bacterium]|nr:shikimate kinase [Actinomycetota bacterium]